MHTEMDMPVERANLVNGIESGHAGERGRNEDLNQEGREMAFVNEYVSDEDIKKYNLDRVWLDRNAVYKIEGKLPSGFRHKWTVDRESDTYFMVVGGGGYDRNVTRCLLYRGGQFWDIELAKPGEGSNDFSEQPYRIVWALETINLRRPETAHREVIQVLKEALTVYGYAGPRSQAPGTTLVEFKF